MIRVGNPVWNRGTSGFSLEMKGVVALSETLLFHVENGLANRQSNLHIFQSFQCDFLGFPPWIFESTDGFSTRSPFAGEDIDDSSGRQESKF